MNKEIMLPFNRTGAIGAMLDIYEQVIRDLQNTIEDIPDSALPVILDPLTTDENCRSFQSILSHVIYSGYGYATSIHNLKGNNKTRPDKAFHLNIKAYLDDLNKVFEYTEAIFAELKDADMEQLDNSQKIMTRWGQLYDIEQLMEHAITHVMRHQRQIIKFKRGLI